MKKLVRQEVKLSKANYDFIQSLKEKENATFNEIINAMISRYLEDKNNKLILTKKRKPIDHKLTIFITQDEYYFLQEQAIYHGYSSATKELKFLLTNLIYNKAIFSNINMGEMQNAINDMNKLGRNINELIKILKEKKDAKINLNIDRIGSLLNDIYSKIDVATKLVTEYQNEIIFRVG